MSTPSPSAPVQAPAPACDPPDPERALLLAAERVSVRYALQPGRGTRTLREIVTTAFDPRRLLRADGPAVPPGHWALRDVSVGVARGEVLGVIGRNGAGKTTLLQVLAGIFQPDQGHVLRRGRIACLLSLGAGFHGNLTGRENVYLNGAVLGVEPARIASRFDEVVAFSDLGRFIDAPVRTYSAGMRARLGFSVALLVEPEIVILDEILRVGDAAFREKAGSIVDRFRGEGRAIVLATHSPDILRRHASRVVWLDRGRVRAIGAPDEIAARYLEDVRREPDRIGAAD